MTSTFLRTKEQFRSYDESLKRTYKGLCIGIKEIVDFVRLKSNRKKENTCAYIVLRNIITNDIETKRFDNYRKTCKRIVSNSLYRQGVIVNSQSEFDKIFKHVEIAGLKVIETKFNYHNIVDENFNYVKCHDPKDKFLLVECLTTKRRKWINIESIKTLEKRIQIESDFKIKISHFN